MAGRAGKSEEAAASFGRAEIYRFLATAFLAPPTAGALQELERAQLLEDLGALFSEDALASMRATSEGDLDVVRQEFMDLFKVPMGKYLPPYEAVHRDSRMVDGQLTRGLLMGPSTVKVRGLYERAGAKLEVEELPDHIGVELSFLAFLCYQEGAEQEADQREEAGNYRRYRKAFLEDHVLRWVPSYCKHVGERAETPYFKALSAMTAEFCKSDLDAVARELEPEEAAEADA